MNIIFNSLNWLLNYIFTLTGDLGITIILLTIIVRVLLLPIDIKQKKGMMKQQELSKKMECIKEKYKNNKVKLEEELQKHYKESAKAMLGCAVTFLQLPVVFSLYSVVIKLPINVGTVIIPWVATVKMADSYFIIPAMYAIASTLPNLINSIPYLRALGQVKVSKVNIIITTIFSLLITIKAPIAIGIYFITTSLFSLLEEIAFRLYLKAMPAN